LIDARARSRKHRARADRDVHRRRRDATFSNRENKGTPVKPLKLLSLECQEKGNVTSVTFASVVLGVNLLRSGVSPIGTDCV
jgi:hypothetical protein